MARKKSSKLVLPNLERRTIRYIMFRIKRDAVDTLDFDLRRYAGVLKEHFDAELQEAGLTWGTFTFGWDVSPSDPYKVIPKDVRVWVQEGGSFEGRPPGMDQASWAKHVLATLLVNQKRPLVPFDPPAFTGQA